MFSRLFDNPIFGSSCWIGQDAWLEPVRARTEPSIAGNQLINIGVNYVSGEHLSGNFPEVQNMASDEEILQAAARSMECSVNSAHERLKQGLNALATIGSTAPFVGLFGTVIGIINSFHGSGERSAGMGLISGGIAEALVTTGLGLLVAVPAVFAYNYFTSKLELFDLEMNHSMDAIETYLSGFQATKRDR